MSLEHLIQFLHSLYFWVSLSVGITGLLQLMNIKPLRNIAHKEQTCCRRGERNINCISATHPRITHSLNSFSLFPLAKRDFPHMTI